MVYSSRFATWLPEWAARDTRQPVWLLIMHTPIRKLALTYLCVITARFWRFLLQSRILLQPLQGRQPRDGMAGLVSCGRNHAGHSIADCPKVEKKNQAKGSAFVRDSAKIQQDSGSFISLGFIALDEDLDCVPEKVSWDTRGLQSLLLAGVLHAPELAWTLLLKGINGYQNAPLQRVHFKSDFVTGIVDVATLPELQIQGVSFILANDLAGEHGDAAFPIPKISVDPVLFQEDDAHTKELQSDLSLCNGSVSVWL